MLCFIFGAFRTVRTIAQFGSALDWGSRGRGFKSRWSDQESPSFRRFPRHRNGGFFRIQGRSGAMYYGPPPRGMRYGRAPVPLMRGFRPPWDETFRADGAAGRNGSRRIPSSTTRTGLWRRGSSPGRTRPYPRLGRQGTRRRRSRMPCRRLSDDRKKIGSVKPELTLRVPKKILNVNSALDSRDSKYSIRRIRNIQLAVRDTQANFVWLRVNA